MNIKFDARRFAKEVNDSRRLVRRHGERRANLIRRRLDELRAASTLEEMRYLPAARCHELHGNRSGQLSVDLDHPYRLIFVPEAPVPVRDDGGLDWERVTAIVITGVEDTHA